MNDKEQQKFDAWWRENRARLIRIYNEEISLDMAILEIVEATWKASASEEAKRRKGENKD